MKYRCPNTWYTLNENYYFFHMPKNFCFPQIQLFMLLPHKLTIFHSVPLRLYQFWTNTHWKFCNFMILFHYMLYNYIFQLQSNFKVNHTTDLYENNQTSLISIWNFDSQCAASTETFFCEMQLSTNWCGQISVV